MTISAPCTALDREKSGEAAETETMNKESSRSFGHGRQMIVCAAKIEGRALQESRGAEKSPKKRLADYSPEVQAKARALYAEKDRLRRIAGNCGRCGRRPAAEGYKQCDRCREYMAKRRITAKYKAITSDPNILTAIMRRIQSLEHTAAIHSMIIKKRYDKGYKKGYKAGRSAEFRLWQERPVEMPTITKQELATMNHAYDKGDDR